MKQLIKQNRYFLLPYFLFLILGSILLLLKSKTEIHLYFNSIHYSFLDVFFYYCTYLGDGFAGLTLFILLLFISYKFAFIQGITTFSASAITQILKNTIYSEELRPKKYFENIQQLYFVPGVENYSFYSFPSGHSTTAFAMYFSLALIIPNNRVKLSLSIIAIIVGYSRVYLSQHFFQDIYFGSIIGVFTTLYLFYIIENSSSVQSFKWINSSLTNKK